VGRGVGVLVGGGGGGVGVGGGGEVGEGKGEGEGAYRAGGEGAREGEESASGSATTLALERASSRGRTFAHEPREEPARVVPVSGRPDAGQRAGRRVVDLARPALARLRAAFSYVSAVRFESKGGERGGGRTEVLMTLARTSGLRPSDSPRSMASLRAEEEGARGGQCGARRGRRKREGGGDARRADHVDAEEEAAARRGGRVSERRGERV